MRKWIAGLLATAVVALAIAGCSSTKKPEKAPAAEAPKKAAVSLTVWSHLTQPEVDELNKLAQEWAKKTGNKVEVLMDQTGFQEYASAAQAGNGPDIMYGLAHDNLGTFQKAGMLEPVPADLAKKDEYEPVSVSAVSYDGKMFALPVSMEAIALFYNKALVKEVPQTWDQFLPVAKEKGFVYDIKNFYHSFGFLAGSGGYIFKDKGGSLDPKDVGLANQGAKDGLKLLNDLVNTHKLMTADISGDMAKSKFVGGKAAFYLSGPWDIGAAKEGKIDFGIAPMPKLPNGQNFKPFVGVQAAFVGSGSKHKAEAWDLVKYFQENAALPLFKTGNRIPVQKKFRDHADVKANAALVGFGASAADGMPMPNIPAMSTVWDPAGKMIDLVVTKKVTPDQAATDAVKAINDAVSAMK